MAARVPSNRAVARDLGFDVETWVKERLVDVLVPCNDFRNIDFRMDYAEWDALTRIDPNLRIVVGVDAGIAKEFLPLKAPGATPRSLVTKAELRGWAERLYAAGCCGVYFFNLFQHPMDDPNSVYNWVLNGGLLPERVAKGGKRVYVLTQNDFPMVDSEALRADQNVFGPLPSALDKSVELTIGIGKPIPGARVRVRVALDAANAPVGLAETVRLNGQKPVFCDVVPVTTWIPTTRFSKSSVACEFSADAVRPGANRVTLSGGFPSVTVYACELELDDGKDY